MKTTAKQYAKTLHALSTEMSDADIPAVMERFVDLLQADRATHMLPRILKEYRALLFRRKVLPEVTVTTPVPLDAETRSLISEAIGASASAVVHEHHDPEMVSGIFARYNNRIMDLSLRNRITRLVKYLAQEQEARKKTAS